MYGLKMWLPSLEASGYRVGIVCRHSTVRSLATELPGVRVRHDAHVEKLVTPSTRLALYPAYSTLNIHLQRDTRLVHCFVGHGDSDKAGSASPVSRSYDEIWVAGEAAVERYAAAGVEIAPEAFVQVGRPNLSPFVRDRHRAKTLIRLGENPERIDRVATMRESIGASAVPKVMYAPTWEGYFEKSNYSSLASFASAIQESSLLDAEKFDLLFRPHPMTGHRTGALKSVVADLRRGIRKEHGPERGPDLYRFTDLDIVEWFDCASVLVSDVSSVASDWLAWNRPLILTNPTHIPLEEFVELFPTARAAYVASTGEEMLRLVELAIGEDPLRERREYVRTQYLGDAADPFDRFSAALSRHLGARLPRPVLTGATADDATIPTADDAHPASSINMS